MTINTVPAATISKALLVSALLISGGAQAAPFANYRSAIDFIEKPITLVRAVGGAAPKYDANGWTILTPTPHTSGTCAAGTSDGSCIYYVSNAGTDNSSNCKGYDPPVTSTPATMCKTLAFALGTVAGIRRHKNDWIVFHRGETFVPTDGTGNQLWGLGINAALPFVFGAYGTSTDPNPIFDLKDYTQATTLYFSFFAPSHIAIVDQAFTVSTLDPNSPNFDIAAAFANSTIPLQSIVSTAPGTGSNTIIIENTQYTYIGGPSIQAQGADVYIRRNYIGPSYSWRNSSDNPLPASGWNHRNNFATNGIFASQFKAFVLEENLFYSNNLGLQFITGGQVTIDIPSSTLTWVDTVGQPPTGQPPNGAIVGIGSTGTLPTGITKAVSNCGVQQCYYLVNSSAISHTAQISTNKSGPAITFSGTQSGTHTAYWVDPEGNSFNHCVYTDLGFDSGLPPTFVNSGPMIVRRNIFSYCPNAGQQFRPGGVAFNNLYLKSPTSFNGAAFPSTVTYNVLLQGTNFQFAISTGALGWALPWSNLKCTTPPSGTGCQQPSPTLGPVPGSDGSTIANNIVSQSESSGGNGQGIWLGKAGANFYGNNPDTVGNIVTGNIVCNWATVANRPIWDESGLNTVSGNFVPTVNFTGAASCPEAKPGAPDPNRTVGQYYDTLVGGSGHTTDDFLLAAAATWNRQNWDPRYGAAAVNSYIRAGFGMADP